MLISWQSADVALRGMVLAAIALAWVVVLVRIVGLRSLSKMTPFDFVMTIALGSLVSGAAQADSWSKFAQPLVAMVGLFTLQWLAAKLRRSSQRIEHLIQNQPMLLMRDGEIIEGALAASRVGRNDLFAKLREANVLDLSQVRAVVLETTGDVSVLHGEKLHEKLIDGIPRPG